MNSCLRRLRESLGKSQLQLAEDANVSTRTIQFAESGKQVSAGTANRLANALEVSTDQLLQLEEESTQDAFIELPWAVGDHFRSRSISKRGSLCRDEAEVIEVVQKLRENFQIQIRKWGSDEDQAVAIQRDEAISKAYFRYEQRYVDLWRKYPPCIQVDRVDEVLCGVSVVLPINQTCFDSFASGHRAFLDITADDIVPQSQHLILDSVTEFVDQVRRPWHRITQSLSFIAFSQIAHLADRPGDADFRMASIAASPLNENRLHATGFRTAKTREPEFGYPLCLFDEDNLRFDTDRFARWSTMRHFAYLIKTVESKSIRRRMTRNLLALIKRLTCDEYSRPARVAA